MTGRTTAALLLSLLAVSACRDAAGPAPPADGRMELSLIAQQSPPIYRTQDGAPQIQCDVGMVVRADGDEGMTAVLTGMMFRFHMGSMASPPVDSVLLSGSEAGEAFGGRFRPGEEREATLRLTAGVPFFLGIEARYRTSAQRDGAARAEYTCGGDPGTDAPMPVIRITPLPANPAEPEPGSRLQYVVEGESAIGFWDVDLRVHGAVERTHRWIGEGRRVFLDTVMVEVPSDARLGEAIALTASARDVALRRVESAIQTVPVTDRTPPVLEAVSVDDPAPEGFRGQFPEDDPPSLRIWTRENGQVAWVVFSGGTTGRDSVPYTGEFGTYPLPVERARAGDLHVEVRDAAGNLSGPVVAPAGSFLFFPRRTAVVRQVPLPEYASITALGPTDERVFVLGGGGYRVHVVSLERAVLETTLALEHRVEGIDVSDDGLHLIAARSDSSALDLIELTPPHTRRSIPLSLAGVSIEPWTMKAAVGGKVFLLGTSGERTVVVEVALGDGAMRIAAEAGLLYGSRSISRSGDYRRMVIAGRCLFDPVSHAIDCRPRAPNVPINGDRTGSIWAFRGDIYDQRLNPIPVRAFPSQHFSALSPDGRYLFSSMPRGLLRVRTTDGVVEEGFLPATPRHASLSVVADGSRVVIYGEDVTIYDLP